MIEKNIVILGTARDDSNTLKGLVQNSPFGHFELIELNKLNIEPYSYDEPALDDFLAIVQKMVAAEKIVFATPVYWYAMSGCLKNFFDRFTDLISTSKDVGRSLAEKEVYLFVTGSDSKLPDGFEVPFIKTSEYFDMKYRGAFYTCTKNW